MKNFGIAVISVLILAADQYSKWVIKSSMRLYESIPLIGEKFFRLTYVENVGIAFGLYFGGRIILVTTTLIAIIFLLFYIRRLNYAPLIPKIAMGLILGGALGNLVDRIFRGSVVDFLDFDFPDFIMNRWPVFNLADSSVSVGMTILIIYLLFFDAKYNNAALRVEAEDVHPPHDTQSAEENVNNSLPAEMTGESGFGGNKYSGGGQTTERED